MWFGVNSEDNLIGCHSVDAMSILPFIRGRDFQITEMWGSKNNKEKEKNEGYFWSEEEAEYSDKEEIRKRRVSWVWMVREQVKLVANKSRARVRKNPMVNISMKTQVMMKLNSLSCRRLEDSFSLDVEIKSLLRSLQVAKQKVTECVFY